MVDVELVEFSTDASIINDSRHKPIKVGDVPPAQNPSQYRALRWIVRRGPLIAAVVITACVAAKTLSLISGVLSLPLARTDFVGVLETADQVPWPIAILLLLASWMTVFLGVPLWRKYLAYEAQWSRKGEDESQGEHSVTRPSKGARQRR